MSLLNSPSAVPNVLTIHIGWLFSDSTSVETAEKALNAHMKGNSDEAEILLASDFGGDRLNSAIMQMCQLDEFRERRAQLGRHLR